MVIREHGYHYQVTVRSLLASQECIEITDLYLRGDDLRKRPRYLRRTDNVVRGRTEYYKISDDKLERGNIKNGSQLTYLPSPSA